MQAAFRECHGLQCGFCTPGMVMSRGRTCSPSNPKPERGRGARRRSTATSAAAPATTTSSRRSVLPSGRPRRRLRSRRAHEHAGPSKSPIGQACAGARTAASSPARPLHRRHRPPGQTFGVFVRARTRTRGSARSTRGGEEAAPGVVDVFTGADLAAAKVGGLPVRLAGQGQGRHDHEVEPAHPALARRRSATSAIRSRWSSPRRCPGQGGAELDRGRLRRSSPPGSPSAQRSIGDADPRRHRRQRLLRLGHGTTRRRSNDAFAGGARHHFTFVNNRLIPNAIEPRAALASYDAATRATRSTSTSQNPHLERLPERAFVPGCRSTNCAWSRPTWAAASARRSSSIPKTSTVVWASKRDRPAGQVDGRAREVLPHRRARPRPCHDRPSWRLDATATSSACA